MARESVSPETKVHTVPTLSAVPVPDTGATGATPTDVCRRWKSVNAIVMGNHEIPQRTAMHIPVSVPNATVGCDLCLEGRSRENTLAIESTLNTMREGGRTVALVGNTTGDSVKLRNGVFLGRALAFDGQVLPELLELKHTPAGAVNQPCAGDKTSQASSVFFFFFFLKVGDYNELKGSLLKLIHQYRDVIALPDEPLGTTNTTEQKIRVKPDTEPMYIPAYRLPHNQRQVADEQVKDMLDQGVIQHSRSPWNSLLFLFSKKVRSPGGVEKFGRFLRYPHPRLLNSE